MSESLTDSRIDDVAAGDIVFLDRGDGEIAYKVVHKESAESSFMITFEGDDGETFQLRFATGAPVKRSLESKWESAQSPTAHTDR
jgi:hypothetical protein